VASIEQGFAFVDKLVDRCTEVVREQDAVAALPERLYHFTDVAGFEGILASRTLWSSLATALNDAEEVRYAIGLAKTIATERAPDSTYYREVLDALERPMVVVPFAERGLVETRMFVTSFCGRCDKAAQWLHYGRGGRGVAIGFGGQKLAKLLGREVIVIDYDPASQKRRIKQFLEAGEEVTRAFWRGNPDPIFKGTAHLISTYLPVLAARMKHPSFADEEESRLVGIDLRVGGKVMTPSPERLKWRRPGGAMVPYEELSFQGDPSVVEEIVVGYSSELGLDSAALCASDHLGLDATVRRSEVPVRGALP